MLGRYGIPTDINNWAKFHDRFDTIKELNEVNRFGWVVEIDPMDPTSTPVKRTALGHYKREGAGNIINRDGRFVAYQGDDQKFDYVYRFVIGGTVNRRTRRPTRISSTRARSSSPVSMRTASAADCHWYTALGR